MVRETMQATRLGVVPRPYQPLPLLNAQSQHPFVAYCLLHQHFGKGCLLQTKQLTGLLLSVDTQWCMTASVSITPNHQLLSSCLESHTHSAATNRAELTAVKPCWHRSHHCWQLSAVVLQQVPTLPASIIFVRLQLKPLSRPLSRRSVLCNCCTSILPCVARLMHSITCQKAKLAFPFRCICISLPDEMLSCQCTGAEMIVMLRRHCRVSNMMKRHNSQPTLRLKAMAQQAQAQVCHWVLGLQTLTTAPPVSPVLQLLKPLLLRSILCLHKHLLPM